MPQRILVVDDEHLARWSLGETLRDTPGYQVEEADSVEAMLEKVDETPFDLIMLDVGLPGMSGVDGLRSLRERHVQTPVIMVTAQDDEATTLACLRHGAFDYVCKPVEMAAIEAVVKRALASQGPPTEEFLPPDQQADAAIAGFVGISPPVQALRDQLRRIVQRGARTILVQGESGTGKDVLAKAIHQGSSRAAKPFMEINCTALPAHLLESELFGHEKGAFTDAKNRKQGLLELANEGTVLLDEIGDMDQALQAKLLRVLEERRFKRVGGVEDIQVDVCIIATTNVDLEQAVEDGCFRQDLFFRLNVVPLHIPPLRERREDIPVLVQHFLQRLGTDLHSQLNQISRGALSLLCRYDWPGNVRELRNLLERIMVLEDGETVLVDHLPKQIRDLAAAEQQPDDTGDAPEGLQLGTENLRLEDIEKELMKQALARTDGNLTRAGELLGVHRDTLRYRARKYGLID